MSEINQSKVTFCPNVIPPVGWALANIICLATGGENNNADSGRFSQGFDCVSYVHVFISLAENLMARLESFGCIRKENQEVQSDIEAFSQPIEANFCESDAAHGSFRMSYLDFFKPVCQQWHLTDLLATIKKEFSVQGSETLPHNKEKYFGKLELLDIAYLYSYILRIFTFLNPTVGSLPVLNMLSFTPGFLFNLWGALEISLFQGDNQIAEDHYLSTSKTSRNKKDGVFDKKQNQGNKDVANKWVSVLHKFTSKSQSGSDGTNLVDEQFDEDFSDVWDVEPLRHGPQGVSKDLSCLLHLFCATYSHMLLILDDIEFYEKQVNISGRVLFFSKNEY